jgi:hypothetical protein
MCLLSRTFLPFYHHLDFLPVRPSNHVGQFPRQKQLVVQDSLLHIAQTTISKLSFWRYLDEFVESRCEKGAKDGTEPVYPVVSGESAFHNGGSE